jgi:hypothetical protein
MAKARQVGTPQSPQFVLGNSLNISIPVNAILKSPFPDENQYLIYRFVILGSSVTLRINSTKNPLLNLKGADSSVAPTLSGLLQNDNITSLLG